VGVTPDLNKVLNAITGSWLLFVVSQFFAQPSAVRIIAIVVIWLLLFSGFWAKIKGFKIANGISSICLITLSTFSVYYFIEVVLKSGFQLSMANLFIIPQVIILVLSINVANITLTNKDFTILYNDKNDVSDLARSFFKISATIFMVGLGLATANDLLRLGVF
jgi:hypothetical protein